MQFSAIILSAIAAAVSVSAQGATINNFTPNCGSQTGSTFVPSDNGRCWAQDTSAWIKVVSEDCPVTVYTDGSCSFNGNIANVGDCRTGVASFSIDC